MTEIEIKDRIVAITGDSFSQIQLTPMEIPILIGGDVTPVGTYIFITEVCLGLTDILDFGNADGLYLELNDFSGNTPFLQFNMSSPLITTNYVLNTLQIDFLATKVYLQGALVNGDAIAYVRGYDVEIIP